MSEPSKTSTTSGLHPRLETEITAAFTHSLRVVPEIYGLRRELALFLGWGVPEETLHQIYERLVEERAGTRHGKMWPAPAWEDLRAQVRERPELGPTKRRADIDAWLAEGGRGTDSGAA